MPKGYFGDTTSSDWVTNYKNARELNRMVAQDLVDSGRAVGRVARNLKRRVSGGGNPKRRKTKAAKKAAKGGSVKVTMSNGSGQAKPMKGNMKKGRSGKKSIKKRVASLEKKTRENYSDHTFKQTATFRVLAVQNRCGYQDTILISAGGIEQLLAAVPYVNTASVGTPSTYDARALTNPTKFKIRIYTMTTMRNNYLYPVNLRCYLLKPKSDTSITPLGAINNGLNEQANPSIYSTTDPYLYPNDSKEFQDNWTIVHSCEMKLQSGDECYYPYAETVLYDQEYTDDHTSAYLKKYSRHLLVRAVGVVAHDSTTKDNVGIAPAELDCVTYRRYNLKIPGIASLKTNYVTTGLNTMAVAPVVGVASAEVETAL